MDLEGQYNTAEQALNELRHSLQAKKLSSQDQLKHLAELERLAQRVKNALESYRLEMRELARNDQGPHLTRLKNLEDGLKQCRTQMDWKRLDVSAKSQGADGGGSAAAEDSRPITLDQAVAVAENTQKESKSSLARSLGMVLQAEQVGIATLEKMHAQEEQMSRIGEDMEDIKENLKRSKKLVGQIARSAANDRCIQALCAMIAIAILIMITLAITGHDGGQLKSLDAVRQDGT
eukprot:TRINITY_DN7658_c0_g1_i1.p1 TRINITY_DN7658_c0_g1~~TRINITY_DN7658_c0_g1_i1.p1  ORF type:complete len:234 (+),score=64.38 TRINITY_DN7658_c0_g1_i1:138-839(+)